MGNGGNDVSNDMAAGLPQSSDEITQLLQRAEAGDESVGEQVRELLMICPELTDPIRHSRYYPIRGTIGSMQLLVA